MFALLFAVFMGIIIGTITNALAIKMLFRPLRAWKLFGFQLPFTPGLVPKHRDEIAEKLGMLVEEYLFTAQGMKSFIEKSGFQELILIKIFNKITSYQGNKQRLGEFIATVFQEDWQVKLQIIRLNKIGEILESEHLRASTLKELLPEQTQLFTKEQLSKLSPLILQKIREFFHTLEGKRWLVSSLRQAVESKKMLGFLTGVLLTDSQLQEKLLSYIDRILTDPNTTKRLEGFLLAEWEKIIIEPISTYINKYQGTINLQASRFVSKGTEYLDQLPISKLVNLLEKNQEFLKKLVNQLLDSLIVKMDSLFTYLSIAKVVESEVSRFSLLEIEKLIIEIAGRELKMITIFGGVLGGLLGLIQGLYFIFL